MQNAVQLYDAGADQVLPEKLEIAIDMLNRILLKRLVPQREINRILFSGRIHSLGDLSEKDIVNRPSLLDEFPNINISAIRIDQGSIAEGKSIIETDIRKKTGATLLVIRRGSDIIEHPDPAMTLQAGDIAYMMGDIEQLNNVSNLFIKKLE
jgi:CPA2 family monovalent cation:H+ antiporter-2